MHGNMNVKYSCTVCYISLRNLICHADVNRKTAVVDILLSLKF